MLEDAKSSVSQSHGHICHSSYPNLPEVTSQPAGYLPSQRTEMRKRFSCLLGGVKLTNESTCAGEAGSRAGSSLSEAAGCASDRLGYGHAGAREATP